MTKGTVFINPQGLYAKLCTAVSFSKGTQLSWVKDLNEATVFTPAMLTQLREVRSSIRHCQSLNAKSVRTVTLGWSSTDENK